MITGYFKDIQLFDSGVSADRLDSFRILFALATGISFMSLPWEFYANIPDCLWSPQGTAEYILRSPPDLQTILFVKYIFLGSLLTLCFGFFSQFSAFVAAASLYFLMGTSLSAFYYDRSGNTLLICLFVLSASPGLGAKFSLDSILWKRRPINSVDSIWPARLIQFLFFSTFFAAGVSKLLKSGWSWAEADNLIAKWTWAGHNFYPNKLFSFQDTAHNFMIQQHEIAGYIGFFVLILELSSLLFFLFQKTRPWGVILLASLQVGILLIMYISFNLFLPLYLIFVPSEKIFSSVQRKLK